MACPVQPEMESNNNLGAKRAAVRKLSHELGVPKSTVNENEVKFLTKILYKAPSDEIWGEYEGIILHFHSINTIVQYNNLNWRFLIMLLVVDYILFIQKDVELDPNPNEVRDYKYYSKEQLQAFLQKAEEEKIPITPWFKLICKNFLFEWWDNFKELPEDNQVHKMV